MVPSRTHKHGGRSPAAAAGLGLCVHTLTTQVNTSEYRHDISKQHAPTHNNASLFPLKMHVSLMGVTFVI